MTWEDLKEGEKFTAFKDGNTYVKDSDIGYVFGFLNSTNLKTGEKVMVNPGTPVERVSE